MTQDHLTAGQIADFLAQNPDFFARHSALFSTLQVPASDNGQVISFAERQITHLQEENRQLKQQLATLIRNAQRSEQIRQRMHQWACLLIRHPQWATEPDTMARELAALFELDFACLLPAKPPYTEVHQSYSGPVENAPLRFELPTGMHSLAYTPLVAPQSHTAKGLLLVAARDGEHFGTDMATDFLEQIGALCATALGPA